jgi:pullulanase
MQWNQTERREGNDMAIMHAYLDDYGRVEAVVSRNYNNGVSAGFYLEDETGRILECLIAGVEQHEHEVFYHLTIPATFSFERTYTLWENHGISAPLEVRYIVQTKEFDRQFTYERGDLGPTYFPDHTVFALWAPTAHLAAVYIHAGPQAGIYMMKRGYSGVWRAEVEGDLAHAEYLYIIHRDGQVVKTTDPYALSSTANGTYSAVIDTRVLDDIPDDAQLPALDSMVDAIIYECSVRDMTSSRQTGTAANGTFSALAESGSSWKGNPTGLDYIQSLGVTHVQVQPVSDFVTVDELHPSRSYNWGYDPMSLLGLEGSYSSNPNDPYARMKEFKKMVAAFHSKGIRVNVDVVFNHLYDAYASSLNQTVPYYFFRYTDSRWLSNGSGCGNDLESRRPMMRLFFRHILTTWMKMYNVDGYRFDLMGILDVETMNMLAAACRAIKPEAMIYGEGWDLPTALPQEDKAKIYNQRQMPTIAHFNDTFRDVAKGPAADDRRFEKGYLTGNTGMAFDMCSALAANTMGAPYFQRFDNPTQSINALETHDNATVWDKMHFCCADEPRALRLRRMKMMIAATFVAQGIPFVHAGFEFAATKQENTNSYNAGDDINQMNWDRADFNKELIVYTRACIAMRKKYAGFRLRTAEQLNNCLHFETPDNTIVWYDINYEDAATHTAALRVLINADWNERQYHFDEDWCVVLDEQGCGSEEIQHDFTIPMCSVLVLRRPME